MSLINQMLQELDARGAAPVNGGVLQGQIRPAPASRRRFPLGLSVLVTALALGGGAAWFWLSRPASTDTSRILLNADGTASAHTALAQPPLAPENPAPDPMQMPVSGEAMPLKLETTLAEAAPAPVSAAVAAMPAAQAAQATAAVPAAPAAQSIASPAVAVAAAMTAPAASTPIAAEPAAVSSPVAPVPSANASTLSGAAPAPAAARASGPEPANPGLTKQVRALSSRQQAENDYRKAASLIQQGRADAAISLLEQALRGDEQHAAARQTLAALLLESRRPKEAELALREGVRLDPAQTGMAMILARLQLEHSTLDAALETLQRSLPHAAGRADYHAFLAALLQRAGRHNEAITHYSQALRQAPDNGVWWMGQGISLQAEKRVTEAADAYARAKASNSLSPELQAFVNEKLNSL